MCEQNVFPSNRMDGKHAIEKKEMTTKRLNFIANISAQERKCEWKRKKKS